MPWVLLSQRVAGHVDGAGSGKRGGGITSMFWPRVARGREYGAGTLPGRLEQLARGIAEMKRSVAETARHMVGAPAAVDEVRRTFFVGADGFRGISPWLKSGVPALARLARKISLYVAEMKFSARVPTSIGDKLRLFRSTVDFHYRNWRKLPIDPNPRLRLALNLDGYNSSITLRPRDADLGIFHEVLARHAYDVPHEILPPNSVRTIVDAGANIGLTSLYLAGRYRQATVFSVEPNPDNFALLEENAANEDRIVPIKACLTAEPDQKVYITTAGRASNFKMNTAGNGELVRGMSIAQLCAEHEIEHIDLLKMDIEGAEIPIFKDGSFLPKVGVIVAELHGWYDLARFNADLARWGFRAWISEKANDPHVVVAARMRAG